MDILEALTLSLVKKKGLSSESIFNRRPNVLHKLFTTGYVFSSLSIILNSPIPKSVCFLSKSI